ncbi:hypothetical protein PoB_004437800 [Plakobranchus ocellatus]|uniref:Uncharacterized protein n=1 Tax=Plakobranchus ocellatus TaxID=259542 RepID=A0AAV4BE60_9GAST|nr:hypothetical protein PoB_004437800 [Plakobranchus ocellatus]
MFIMRPENASSERCMRQAAGTGWRRRRSGPGSGQLARETWWKWGMRAATVQGIAHVRKHPPHTNVSPTRSYQVKQ